MKWLLVAAFAIFATYAPIGGAGSFTPAWQSLRIGGGGLMNNVQIAADGTEVASSNTDGAYLLRSSGTCAGSDNGGWGSDYAAPCWEQLFTATSAPLTLTQRTQLNQGVAEIDSCPGNTNDAYAFFNGTLWSTTNLKAAASARLWTATSVTTSSGGNQGVTAGTSRIIQCDPNNPNVVYASTPAAVKASGNGLAGSPTFATVSGIGTIGAVPDVMAFDGNPSASTGTCSQFSGSPTCTLHLLIFVDGTGVYESYNGGSSFTLTSGGPVTSVKNCQGGYCFSLKADQFGDFYAAIGNSHLYKYVPNGTAGGGTWTAQTPSVTNSLVGEFALDQSSGSEGALRIAAAYGDGNVSVSTNGGSTWCSASAAAFTSSGAQPPWFANANQNQGSSGLYFAVQDFAFDASGNLFMAAGIGMWQIASASVTCGASWTADSVGIENLVANHVDAPAGNPPVAATWDRPYWWLANPDAFATDYWPDYTYSHAYGSINGGWAVDWAGSNANFWAGWASLDSIVPATTANGGKSWSIWPSTSAGTENVGGDIAVSTPSNWIVVPIGNSGNLEYTVNGGAAFSAATTTGMSLPITANYQHGFHLAADRVTANAFCLIDNNGDLWASTNSGQTWSKNSTGLEGAGIKYNDALKAVPGKAGTFYYSGGNAGGGSTGYHLWKITKTTNECDTVADVNSNITNIFGFGYGAPIPGGNGFPTIYFYGAYSGVQGLYEIDNGGATPALIGAPSAAQTTPNNSTDFINDVSGDMNFYGRVMVGFNGSGFAYIDSTNACPWVAFSSTLPGASLTGTVTLQAQTSGLPAATLSDVKFFVDGSLIGTQTSYSGGAGGAPRTYSQSWATGGVATGSHTLTVASDGNSCTANTASDGFTIPITTH